MHDSAATSLVGLRRRISGRRGCPTANVVLRAMCSLLLLTAVPVHLVAAVDVCISTTSFAADVTNQSQCLGITADKLNTDVNAPTSMVSSKLVAFTFFPNGTVEKKYTTLTAWTQTVFLAFIRSLSTRNTVSVRCNAVLTGNAFALQNQTTVLTVIDLGAPPLDTLGTFTGYLSDVASVLAIVNSDGNSLLREPQRHDVRLVQRNANSGYCVITFPSAGAGAYGYYGAVYRIDGPTSNAQVASYLTTVAQTRYNNLRVSVQASAALSNTNALNVTTIVDLAASDTPVPQATLPGGVTVAPITESVISWYIYVIIAIGVVGLIGLFVFVAKKASLRKENKKKTVKRRKADQDRFDKIASEMRRGIDVDAEEDAD